MLATGSKRVTKSDPAAMSNEDQTNGHELSAEQRRRVSSLSPEDVVQIDASILASAKQRWRKLAMVIGRAMARTRWDGVPDVYYQTRVQHLVSLGALESQGDLSEMGFSEVRLPAVD